MAPKRTTCWNMPCGTPSASTGSSEARPSWARTDASGHPAGSQAATDPGNALEIADGCGHDVHPGVGVVDPVDRHLVDAQPGTFGEHEHLGVEEPPGVLDQWAATAARRHPGSP